MNGTVEDIKGTYVREGTLPAGSTWAMNPIPDKGSDTADKHSPNPGQPFEPKCKEVEACLGDTGGVVSTMDNPCRCSGEWGPFNMEIVDTVMIPVGLKPGKYVLGWRWDTEGKWHASLHAGVCVRSTVYCPEGERNGNSLSWSPG